jgi:hypothetical protein
MFLDKPRLTSLQAYVLYITTVRNAPLAAPMDALLALAIRLATKLGIHQNHAHNQQQDLAPVTVADKTDIELRRRLWWQIMILDVQMAESNGSDPTIMEGTWAMCLPANVDDDDLDAYSKLPIPPSPGKTFDPDTYSMHNPTKNYTNADDEGRKTDMTYALICMEISHSLRRHYFSEQFCMANGYEYLPTFASRIEFLDDLVRKVNRKYLQYCQRNDFFSFYLRNATKLMLSRHLMLAKRNGSTRESLHNCVQVLEAAVGLRITHSRWTWSLRSYVELDALEVLLHCLNGMGVAPAVGNSDYEAEIQLARALSQAAVMRGREHDLSSCYPEHWERIEVLQKRFEELRTERSAMSSST